jgi:hypothetical protein
MDQWIELRRKIRNEQVSLRQLERDTGIHRQTLRKIRDNGQPPGYQRIKPVNKSKIGLHIRCFGCSWVVGAPRKLMWINVL